MLKVKNPTNTVLEPLSTTINVDSAQLKTESERRKKIGRIAGIGLAALITYYFTRPEIVESRGAVSSNQIEGYLQPWIYTKYFSDSFSKPNLSSDRCESQDGNQEDAFNKSINDSISEELILGEGGNFILNLSQDVVGCSAVELGSIYFMKRHWNFRGVSYCALEKTVSSMIYNVQKKVEEIVYSGNPCRDTASKIVLTLGNYFIHNKIADFLVNVDFSFVFRKKENLVYEYYHSKSNSLVKDAVKSIGKLNYEYVTPLKNNSILLASKSRDENSGMKIVSEKKTSYTYALKEHVESGKDLYQNLVSGTFSDSDVTKENLSRVFHYFMALAEEKKQGYSRGAMTVEDSTGNLTKFVDQLVQKNLTYDRTSTHLNSQQIRGKNSVTLSTRFVEWWRGNRGKTSTTISCVSDFLTSACKGIGVDVPLNSQVPLPGAHKSHLLIHKYADLNGKKRIYLKHEEHGVNTVSDFLSHGKDLVISKLNRKEKSEDRREAVDNKLIDRFFTIVNKNSKHEETAKTWGIQGMWKIISELSDSEKTHDLEEFQDKIKKEFDHVDTRFGREVILNNSDFKSF